MTRRERPHQIRVEIARRAVVVHDVVRENVLKRDVAVPADHHSRPHQEESNSHRSQRFHFSVAVSALNSNDNGYGYKESGSWRLFFTVTSAIPSAMMSERLWTASTHNHGRSDRPAMRAGECNK